jgi:hypothetical protein
LLFKNSSCIKFLATLKSYDETIDEVVKSEVVHPFHNVKPPRYITSHSRSKRTLASASCPSICTAASISSDQSSQSSTYQQITISCWHRDSACVCVSEVRENKNLKGKYARDYREQMFKKGKCDFMEFYGLFRYFGRTGQEKKGIHLSKTRALRFFWARSDGCFRRRYLINDIMDLMIEPCSICIQSRFEKAFYCKPVNFVTSDCSHVFCTECFKHEKIVSILLCL